MSVYFENEMMPFIPKYKSATQGTPRFILQALELEIKCSWKLYMNISNIIKLNRGLSLNIHTDEWTTTKEYKI